MKTLATSKRILVACFFVLTAMLSNTVKAGELEDLRIIESDLQKFEKAVEDLSLIELKSSLFSTQVIYKILDANDVVVFEEVLVEGAELSGELKNYIRKADFLLEVNNTYYYQL
jgi:hypothetical protein